MIPHTAILAVVGGVTVVALGLAGRQASLAGAAMSAAAELGRKGVHAASEIRQLEERIAVAEKGENLPATPGAMPANTMGGGAVTALRTLPSAAPANPLARIQNDPKVQAFWVTARRAALAATYGLFFRGQELTPAQAEKFLALAIRREEQAMDLSAVMRVQGRSATDPEIATLEQQAKAEFTAAMTDLMGAEGYQRWLDFESTLPVRKIVSGLGGVTSMAGAPLTVAQAEELTRVLVNASWRYLRTGATDPQTIDWDAVDAQARTILSAAQLALFQTVEEDGRFGLQTNKLINQAKRAAAGLPPVSAPANPL